LSSRSSTMPSWKTIFTQQNGGPLLWMLFLRTKGQGNSLSTSGAFQ
jgi:hypothetical protein